MWHVAPVFRERTSDFSPDSQRSMDHTFVGRRNTLHADRMSSGQDNRAGLHHLASSWTHWHLIDSSWWWGCKPLIFSIRWRRGEEALSSFSVNSLRLTYWVSRLPTYFGNLQNMLPPEMLGFYLWPVQGNALSKLLETLLTCSLFLFCFPFFVFVLVWQKQYWSQSWLNDLSLAKVL